MTLRFAHCRVSDGLTHFDVELEVVGTCHHGVIMMLTGILHILIPIFIPPLWILINLKILAAFFKLLWIFILVLNFLPCIDRWELRYSQILSQISSCGVKVLLVSTFGSSIFFSSIVLHETNFVFLS